ncbi:MAG: hypothetical protein F4046_09960 [Acidimicrobiaceae bacterium]|nr:hypothetical protein [Acidimicrobiaceae bacterium]
MLDLDFTQEQEMLSDMVRDLCSELSPLERVRELEDDPDGIHRELWQRSAHYLADVRTSLDGARLPAYEAAWAHSNGRSTDQLAPMANLFACRTYREVTAICQQVFGGIGFTVEYDSQPYLRRAKQLQLSWWDQATCEDRIADPVLGPQLAGTFDE